MAPAIANGGDSGLVFNIQRFSVHDGPGIRTTVFLKGCPLRCLWCSNPESQDSHPVLMVRDINCKGCRACLPACPRGAIAFGAAGRTIDRSNCDNCLQCVAACLYDSLQRCGSRLTVQAVVAEVLQDRLFYKNSGGGVTLSGGEPLMQSRFAAAVMAACKQEGLHTALETSGQAPWEEMERVLAWADVILFDIKQLDAALHQRTTGVGNATILSNLRRAATVRPVWLRVPLIAGFNDAADHIRSVALLGKEIGAQKISLLPYHEGGRSKQNSLGRPYDFQEGKAPDEERLKLLKGLIEETGLPASIGS
ncbi:MAG: glycyl-radical enzyme activating protein [Desulfobacterales bacterium]|nr:glycyl-radical enzyme activating protein [Desulfobacterales bacterium]